MLDHHHAWANYNSWNKLVCVLFRFRFPHGFFSYARPAGFFSVFFTPERIWHCCSAVGVVRADERGVQVKHNHRHVARFLPTNFFCVRFSFFSMFSVLRAECQPCLYPSETCWFFCFALRTLGLGSSRRPPGRGNNLCVFLWRTGRVELMTLLLSFCSRTVSEFGSIHSPWAHCFSTFGCKLFSFKTQVKKYF